MEYFAGGLTVCARVFSALSRHLESGVDPGNEVGLLILDPGDIIPDPINEYRLLHSLADN